MEGVAVRRVKGVKAGEKEKESVLQFALTKQQEQQLSFSPFFTFVKGHGISRIMAPYPANQITIFSQSSIYVFLVSFLDLKSAPRHVITFDLIPRLRFRSFGIRHERIDTLVTLWHAFYFSS